MNCLAWAAIACALLLGQMPSASAQPVQSYDSYKNWMVACDNVLSCEAKGFGDEGDRAEIDLVRDMGPSGDLRLTLAAESNFTLKDITIDGKPLALRASDWASGSEDGSSWAATTNLAAARAFAAAVRNAKVVELGSSARVPLDGFSAAMLRVDDRQLRAGGVTALLRAGPAPASRVPAARPIPLIPERPIAAQLAKGEDARLIARAQRDGAATIKAEDCSDRDGMSPPEAFALDKDRALVLIPCLLGAYQGSSIAFIVPRGTGAKITRLTLSAPYAGNTEYSQPIDMFTEGSFDPASGIFYTAAKGRGLADCGFSAGWVWTGSAMTLIELSVQQSCGGIEPGAWPTLYRSRQK